MSSCICTLMNQLPPLKIGDIVYYESPTAEYTLKRGRIVEFKMRKLSGRPLIEVTDKVVMDNGDEVKVVFHTKEDARSYLIKSATSSLGRAKITLDTTQHRIETLQRILKVLEENGA